MSHAFYVYGSYGLAAVICVGLTLWVYLDGRARQAELKLLEARGIRRRSETAATQGPAA